MILHFCSSNLTPMINHLILLTEEQDLHVTDGKLISGHRKIAIDTLGSIQCLSAGCRWSQTALELFASAVSGGYGALGQAAEEMEDFQPGSTRPICEPHRALETLPPLAATRHSTSQWTALDKGLQPASDAPYVLIRDLAEKPQLRENSFNRILRLEASLCPVLLAALFCRLVIRPVSNAKNARPRIPSMPRSITATVFLSRFEWQCLASGS